MAPLDIPQFAPKLDGGSRYLGRDATHLDASVSRDSHEQWRAEQMSAYGEVYSSWRDEHDRKALHDAAWPAAPKTLFPT